MPNTEKQLTAVMQIEQCFDKLQMWLTGDHKAVQYNLEDFAKDIKIAKATERQQHESTFHAGFFIEEWDKSKEDKFETYYNETFKPNK